MSKYIKIFNTESEYNAYSGGTDFITPNISYVKGTDKTKYDENEIRSYKEPSWIEPISLETFTSTTFGIIATYITSVEIPNSVTSIANNAFLSCRNLTSVTIPSGVTSINYSTFEGCSSLTSMEIPSGVTSIYNKAFYDCGSLTSISINAIVPPTLGSYVFNYTNCPIYVPSESVEAYKTATNWSAYADRIQPIPNE